MMRRRRLSFAAMVAVATLLTGCVGVPTSGPVREVTPWPVRVNAGVEIAPMPPGKNATPTEAVEGFLHAMAAHQPDYGVARAYLTPEASSTWQPRTSVLVYAEGHSVSVTREGAVLEAPLVARLSPDGTLTQSSGTFRHDFGLVDVGGQWRISNPPDGLLVSEFLFASSFARHPVYFWAAEHRWLVPDIRYLRRGAGAPGEAVKAVLAGANEWLAPSVQAVPQGQRLESVSVNPAGLALVTLAERTPHLTFEQQSALAVQLVWTLRQFPAVTSVSIRYVGGEPWTVPESSGGVISTSAYVDADPVARRTSHQLFAVSEGLLNRVSEESRGSKLVTVNPSIEAIDKIALRPDAQEAAVVVENRLMQVSLASGDASIVLEGEKSLGRPHYSRMGELWVPNGTETPEVRLGDRWLPASLEGASGSVPTVVRIAPDGARAALVVRDAAGRSRAGVARIVRRDSRINLQGWRPLSLATAQGQADLDVLDVGWSSATMLVALVKDGNGTAVVTIGADGSAPTSMGPVSGSELVEIAVAPDSTLVVLSKAGQAFRYYADYRWSLVTEDVTAVAYPG